MSPEEKIRKAIETGMISHAYIFEGSRISGKEKAAVDFLKRLLRVRELSQDPDYHEVRAEASQGRTVRSVKDADLEKLQADLKMKPQGTRNTALIYDADTMTVRAQNRFLKTLEEPSEGTVIILLSDNAENLLETIRSRCVIYRFYDDSDNIESGENAFSELAESFLEEKTFHEIKKLISSGIKNRDDAYLFLDVLENRYRDIMTGRDRRYPSVTKDKAIRNIELTEETRRALNGNAVTDYAIKRLALKIQEN